MSEKVSKALTTHHCVTELLVGLLGETSAFFNLNAEGSKIVVFKPNIDLLPSFVALNMDLFTSIATDVRNLKLWRDQFTAVDEVKRAHIESVYDFFNEYVNAIDDDDGLRMNHISSRKELDFDDLLAFVTEWHGRLRYISQVVRNTRDLCGVDVMNLVYREWCLQCSEDWTCELLNASLRRMSAAFHDQVRRWMLNGELPPNRVQWMFRDTSAVPAPSSTDHLRLMSLKDLPHLNILSSPSVVEKPQVRGGFRFEIDWARVPPAYGGSPEFIRKIFIIGRNVQLLCEFRREKNYDFRAEERCKLLDDEQIDKSKVWYIPTERARFYSVVERYAEIIGEDVLQEIMKKQRLLDHIAFIQTHFLLLHGDFTMGIYEAIRETPLGNGSTTQHLTTYKLDSIVMECVRYALNFTSTENKFAGLENSLCAGDVMHPATSAAVAGSTATLASVMADGTPFIEDLRASSSPLAESKTKYNNAAQKKKTLRRALIRAADGLFLEDLIRISYSATGLVSEVLNSQILRGYNCIFGSFISWRVLQCRVNECLLRFNEAVRLHRPSLLLNAVERRERKEELKTMRSTRLILANVQRFVLWLLGYVFDEVFETECPRSLAHLQKQPDLASLIAVHHEFFSSISLALFVNRSSQPVFEALRHCVKAARRVLRRVDLLRDWIAAKASKSSLSVDDDEASADDQPKAPNAQMEELWAEKRAAIQEVYTEFLDLTLKLRTAVAALFVTDTKQSPHWSGFEPYPLLVPPTLLARRTENPDPEVENLAE